MGEMPGWLDKLRKLDPASGEAGKLRGTPVHRRIKNYAALSGYAYEYYFEGYRDSRAGREFIFSVSGDRKSWFDCHILLVCDATAAWERQQGTSLGDRERYAIAKLALFAAFDERANPTAMRDAIAVTPEIAGILLEKLDL